MFVVLYLYEQIFRSDKMKKILISILLSITLILGGCGGCTTTSSVSFSDEWIKGVEQNIGLTETLTYDVTLDKNFIIGDLAYKEQIDETKLDYSFENGKYVVLTKIVEAKKELLTGVSSEVLNSIANSTDQSTDKKVISIYTELQINFTYKTADMSEPVTNTDKIATLTYILRNANSFAPIYSATESIQTLVSVGKNVVVEQQHTRVKNVYNLKKVESTIEYLSTKAEDKGTILRTDTKTAKYTYKNAIDNNAMLVAIRSLSLSDSSADLPVYTAVYGKPQNITVAKSTATVDNFQIKLNDEVMAEEEIQLTPYKLSLNASSGCSTGTNTGRPQIAFTNTAQTTPPTSLGSNRTIIMKYVQPLIEYSGYLSMGALVYKLNSVSLAK